MPAGRRFSHFPFIIGALIPCCAQIGKNSVPLVYLTEPDNSGHYWNVPKFAMNQFAGKEDLRWLCRFRECCEQGGIALRINTAAPLTANSRYPERRDPQGQSAKFPTLSCTGSLRQIAAWKRDIVGSSGLAARHRCCATINSNTLCCAEFVPCKPSLHRAMA